MADDFEVLVAAGTLRTEAPLYVVPHAWTGAGMSVEGGGTGAHLLHTAVAACVLNDTYREATALGLGVEGVSVRASGGFDADWRSTGVTYTLGIDSAETPFVGSDLG